MNHTEDSVAQPVTTQCDFDSMNLNESWTKDSGNLQKG